MGFENTIFCLQEAKEENILRFFVSQYFYKLLIKSKKLKIGLTTVSVLLPLFL